MAQPSVDRSSRIVTMPAREGRPGSEDDVIARQIDELERVSSEERDRRLGMNWIRDMKDFYNLVSPNATANMTPTFRPRISIPELQTLVLNEATDLTSDSPKVYILKGDRRETDREKVFQANWRQGLYNNRILDAVIWSMLCNVGWLQIGFAPTTRGGRGSIWMEARDPESVFPDPAATCAADMQWLILEDYLYIDQVKRMWPERGSMVRPRYSASRQEDYAAGFDMPPGPMSVVGGLPNQKIYNDSRVKLRHLFIFDNAVESIRDEIGSSFNTDILVTPKFRPKYPGGRWVVECEGIILADGPNWCPKLPDDELGTFPCVPVRALPGLYTLWGPPPVKFSQGLQETAERMYSQVYENAIRLNNGIWFIHNDTGIDIDSFGGLPGEVQIINQGSQVPQPVYPGQMPESFTKLPQALMLMQKQLQGFTPARSGEPSQGNVSADLFDASVFQSQYLTRLRGRLLAESIQRSAQIIYYMMARFMTQEQSFTQLLPGGGGVASHKWTPVVAAQAYDVYLDPGSISPISGASLRSIMLGLAKAGMVPTKALLESLDIPGGAELAEQVEQQQALAALAKLKRPR
jgi:hypothetical protein